MVKELVRVQIEKVRNYEKAAQQVSQSRFRKFLIREEGQEWYLFDVLTMGEEADGSTDGLLHQRVIRKGPSSVFREFFPRLLANATRDPDFATGPVAKVYTFEVSEDTLTMGNPIFLGKEYWARIAGL